MTCFQARDMCVAFGLAVSLEDYWGSDVITAAIAHLAHSTPEKTRFAAFNFCSYNAISTATGAPQVHNGHMRAPQTPGLGVTPIMEVLGKPLFEIA